MRDSACSPPETPWPAPGSRTESGSWIIGQNEPILVTGAFGFIGLRVVEALLRRGFRNVACFTRASSRPTGLEALLGAGGDTARVRIIKGNLLSRDDCLAAARDMAVIYHLAAGRGERLVADAFVNSVLTTRNLLQATLHYRSLKRFVNVSSFAVYSNRGSRGRGFLDESCPVEDRPELRGDAYSFAKVKQEEIVKRYGERFGIPYVMVRPGVVYGPGNEAIHSRVGIGTFGLFLHLGGSNQIPLTYVDNCAEAIVLAGLKAGVNGEVFNVVDDDLPSSRHFLRLYKKRVRRFRSIYIPHGISYLLCWLWEKYSKWSEGQLPPAFNRRGWHVVWKKTRYSNTKIKNQLGWCPTIGPAEALTRHFESCRRKLGHA